MSRSKNSVLTYAWQSRFGLDSDASTGTRQYTRTMSLLSGDLMSEQPNELRDRGAYSTQSAP